MGGKDYIRIFLVFVWVIVCCTPAKVGAQQRISLQGKITDSLDQPLIGASVVIEEIKDGGDIFFLRTDDRGRYSALLGSHSSYEIRATYLGFQSFLDQVKTELDTIVKDITLTLDEKVIEEIVIHYQYSPVIIKKDTIVFNLDAYRDGSERKIQEVLEKLPGMEVSDGNVRFQGAAVDQTLVEGKPFFGGGSRLAVQNIPADAVGQIEMISHFSEIDFMADVLPSDELAMNMVLKDDHKNLFFGDIEAAYGTEKAHDLHMALFSFSAKRSIQLIGDFNNTGKTVLSLDDIIRLQGGTKNYLTGNRNNRTTSGLRNLTDGNRSFLKRKQAFSAIGYQQELSSKVDMTAFAIFNRLASHSAQNSRIDYFTQEDAITENRSIDRNREQLFGVLDLKLDYNRSGVDKWVYRSHIQLSDDKGSLNRVSLWDSNKDTISNMNNETPFQMNHAVEWNRKFSPNLAILSTLDFDMGNRNVEDNWISSDMPALSVIPEVADIDPIHYIHDKKIRNTDWYLSSGLFWTINRFHQLIPSISVSSNKQVLHSGDVLVLPTDGSRWSLSPYRFGNEVTFRTSDYSGAIEYRFTKDGLVVGVKNQIQYSSLLSKQLTGDYAIRRWLYLPKVSMEYNFHVSHSMNLNVERRVGYPILRMVDDSYQLLSFNTLSRGNPHLGLEEFYTSSLFYRKFSLNRNNISAVAYYTHKTVSFRNELHNNNPREQFYTPQMMTSPDQSLVSSMSYQYQTGYIAPRLSLRGNIAAFTQGIGGEEVYTRRGGIGYTLGVRTTKKGWPVVSLDFDQSFNRFDGLGNSFFSVKNLSSSFRYLFFHRWRLFAEYKYMENTNRDTQDSRTYRLLNADISYVKPKSAWSYHLKANNLTNTHRLISNQLTDYLSDETITYILPRQILLGIGYSL